MPAGGLGRRFSPRLSRFGFPGDGAETAAVTSRRNKSSWTHPCLVGVLLRRRRRGHGGGASRVMPLYRSLSTGPPVFVWQGVVTASGVVVARWVDGVRLPCGGGCRRRRISIRDRGCLGRGPGRRTTSGGSISSVAMSVFCGSSQSVCICAMGLPRIYRWVAVAGIGGPRRWGFLADSVSIGSMDLIAISCFLPGRLGARRGVPAARPLGVQEASKGASTKQDHGSRK